MVLGRPRVSIFPNEPAVARALARRVADALARTPWIVLGLPTGRTPVRFYHELANLAAHGRADFSQVRTFNLDEFLGLPPSHPGSYRQFMEAHLFGRVRLPAERIGFLNGAAPDPGRECARYEKAIAEAGGIDIQILGIGTNGHIGFNEPAPELQSRTHRVRLTPETRRSNAGLFGGDPAAVPAEALSMGMATILQARALVLLATGRTKAACIERVVNGPITTALPASFLQLHHDVEIMLDKAAAERLER
ncbi:MAG TPA: glucosamine-6-phosphate deaminase [Vicinamibacterales bacterium]|nr:glucosamine-6-phosphate deaminase [Vicinamibacterales bacterium]